MKLEPPPLGDAMLPADLFNHQVVLITGGGTGLGRAIAVEFARLGAAVAVASRKTEHREQGIAAVEEVGGKASAVALDVRDPESVAQAFSEVEGALGGVDVLVNNAAGNFPLPAEDLSPNGWRAVTGIVLDGTFFCSSEFARRRMQAGAPGVILNIGAAYAWTGGPGTAHSAAAKAAVLNLTMSLAVEWAPHGIRVNAITPGLFPHEDMPAPLKAALASEDAGSRIPAGRTGEPRELGWAATYLCSPFAAYITGANLVVDGGNWLRRGLRMPLFEPVRDQLRPAGQP